MVDLIGLGTDVWCVRELLPTRPLAHLPRYAGMPLVREMRAFVGNGAVQCLHPYWPEGAIRQGFAYRDHPAESLPAGLTEMIQAATTWTADEERDVRALLLRVAAAMQETGEVWSVDVLDTARGWYVTDCAVAERSFHWPGCPNASTGVFS